jgi:hypothetical protein
MLKEAYDAYSPTQHPWQRSILHVRHRLELVLVAVLAFTLGIGVHAYGSPLYVWLTAN